MQQRPEAAPSVLVLNSGSSSLKFAIYDLRDGGDQRVRARGQIAGIGASPRLSVRDGSGATLADEPLEPGAADGRAALEVLLGWLASKFPDVRTLGVGHRVVHGGERFSRPTKVTQAILDELRTLEPLAPLHQPHNLAGIEAALASMPAVPQVACFDTAFHHDVPEVARVVPLPKAIRDRGLRRYGFHGLSYEYIAAVLPRIAPEVASGRVVVAHLGNGASLCALREGRSVDHTLGFTALDGLCMGTRPGSLDPGVVLHLFQALGLSAADVEDVLYRQSGLLGLSGLSPDMRDLLASDAPAARSALDYFVYRAAREIGGLAAVLGGVDALVFTAGIGENSAEVRHRICEASAWLGVDLDPEANASGATRLTRPGSRVAAFRIPTDEEWMIATHTTRLLRLGPAAIATRE
jgi:acetate kinase